MTNIESLDFTKTSRAELNKHRVAWLKSAHEVGQIDALFRIGRHMSNPGKPYPELSRTHISPQVFRHGDISLFYWRMQYFYGKSRVFHGDFEKIIVTQGGTQPHEFMWGNGKRLAYIFDGEAKTMFEPSGIKEEKRKNFFLPYADFQTWIQNLSSKAIEAEKTFFANSNKKSKNELLDWMGLGEGAQDG